MPIPKQLKTGFKSFGEEIGYEWWLLPSCSDEEAEEFIEERVSQFNGGPGEPFAGRPTIRHSRSYTLISQRQGWDV